MKPSKAELKFKRVMHEFAHSKLKSHGKIVTDRSMALAIAFQEARKIDPKYEMKAEGGVAGERGAELERLYSKGTAKQLWEFWDEKERAHFLIDHAGQFFELMGEDYNKDTKAYTILSYDTLPSPIRKELIIHHAMGIYTNGGGVEEGPLQKLKSQLDDLGIDLEEEDEENLAILRYDLMDVTDDVEAGRLITDYENTMLEKISDTDIKKQIKESISEYHTSSSPSRGKVYITTQRRKFVLIDPATKERWANEYFSTMDEAKNFAKQNNIEVIDPPKMTNGGEIKKLSPAKKKLQDRINTLNAALEKASESAQKSIKKKLAKLKAEFDYHPSTKEKIKQGKGKFALDVPTIHSKSMYKRLWSMKVFPQVHKLNGTSSIIVKNRNNLGKAYQVYSDILRENKEVVPPLSKISRKL